VRLNPPIAEEIGCTVGSRSVEADGAANAARLIAELLWRALSDALLRRRKATCGPRV
jgi:hypothetical protein